MTNNKNPLSRAARALEMLDYVFPGYTTQAAVTEALHDIMHLEDAYPSKLELIGALNDARNEHDQLANPPLPEPAAAPAPAPVAGETAGAQAGGQVVDFEQARFAAGHKDDAGETAGT